VNTIKTYVKKEYRENVATLSDDLHLLADLDAEGVDNSLRNAIKQRLEDSHGDFVPRKDKVLDPLTGQITAYEVGKEYKLSYIRDFDGNLQGGNHDEEIESSYKYQGYLDINGDSRKDVIYTNRMSGRWVTGTVDPLTGEIDFKQNGSDGSTRVVGIYDEPLVLIGQENNGFLSDGVTPAPASIDVSEEERYLNINGEKIDRLALNSQIRMQNDLEKDNLTVKTAGDFDSDGIHEVYWKTNDGTAYLRALMHDDGNIRYANYQSEDQMKEYLTANGNFEAINEII
tara:strand:- start:329 stop:1183 length:855 start_codon:yes stop_codon:yes gene_type:complete